MSTSSSSPVLRVWDLPTRLFHWLLVGAVVGLVVTGNVGGNLMVWHFRFGYTVFALLLFRVLWGLVGGHWSRFASFVPGPGRLFGYLRGVVSVPVGHNPLGALSVLAMLTVLSVQVGTGLISDDEIANSGPLTVLVDGSWVSLATSYHKGPGKLLLLALVVLHVCAIVFYQRIKRKRLVQAMVTGNQEIPTGVAIPPSADGWLQRLLAAGLAGISGAVVFWVVSLGG